MDPLIEKYWQHVVARGEKPRPVYELVSEGGQQPIGYSLGWSISRRETEKRHEAYPGPSRIEKRLYEAPRCRFEGV